MDTDLKCNRLTCRRPVTDKAVVTTCSHIFCVDCANELFNATRLCPACEASLTEPDDVVVCSLNPSNDYKTSVLSGLSPSIILEICGRAISFWQYQIHQENAFQQAVVRSVNDKNAQLQKQLENVVREANGEINILTNKIAELERDLELERRKVRELQDAARDRDKEYQKLKAQYDKIKRKALLAPSNPLGHEGHLAFGETSHHPLGGLSVGNGNPGSAGIDIEAVVGGMQANGIQRTPLVNRNIMAGAPGPPTNAGFVHQAQLPQVQASNGWFPMSTATANPNAGRLAKHVQQRRPFAPQGAQATGGPIVDRLSYRSGTASDRSADSLHEVETLLRGGGTGIHPTRREAGWGVSAAQQAHQRPGVRACVGPGQRGFAPSVNKHLPGNFRPANGTK